jgi:hypothetical protein
MRTMRRAQVAKRIGKSVATVRRLEGTELFPTVDEDGTHRFDPAEVEAFAARLDRSTRPQSSWLRAELARRAEEAEDRDHAARLERQRVDTEAFHRTLAEQRARGQRTLEERDQRTLAEARARLDAVRRDLAIEIASASPRHLRRITSDQAFMRTMEDLFGDE